MSNIIDTQKIIHLTKTDGWKEFKKLLDNEKQKVAMKLLEAYNEELEKERIRVKSYDSIILLVEGFGKSEQLKKRNENKNKGLLGDIKGL